MPPVIKALLRSEEDYVRADASQTQHIFIQKRRDFQRETEFQRATQAAKLQRLFSRPLIRQFDGHSDSVASVFSSENYLLSAGMDGYVKLWDVFSGRQLESVRPHNCAVGAIMLQNVVISAGLDGQMVHSRFDPGAHYAGDLQAGEQQIGTSAIQQLGLTEIARQNLNMQARHVSASLGRFFAVSGAQTQVFDVTRSTPATSLGASTFAAFSAQNPDIICTIDGIEIKVHDLRMNLPAVQFKTNARANAGAFNPQFPGILTLATDDSCAYSFDLKMPKFALDRFGGQTFPLLDVKYAPNGRDFACATNQGNVLLYVQRRVGLHDSVADTIGRAVNDEIFESREHGGSSYVQYRDLYHSKRMLQINSLAFSGDGRFIFSGSAEGAVRQWKTHADENERTLSRAQQLSVQTNKRLVEKFQNVQVIRNISKSHKIPRRIYTASRQQAAHVQAQLRKNRTRGALDVVRRGEDE